MSVNAPFLELQGHHASSMAHFAFLTLEFVPFHHGASKFIIHGFFLVILAMKTILL